MDSRTFTKVHDRPIRPNESRISGLPPPRSAEEELPTPNSWEGQNSTHCYCLRIPLLHWWLLSFSSLWAGRGFLIFSSLLACFVTILGGYDTRSMYHIILYSSLSSSVLPQSLNSRNNNQASITSTNTLVH